MLLVVVVLVCCAGGKCPNIEPTKPPAPHHPTPTKLLLSCFYSYITGCQAARASRRKLLQPSSNTADASNLNAAAPNNALNAIIQNELQGVLANLTSELASIFEQDSASNAQPAANNAANTPSSGGNDAAAAANNIPADDGASSGNLNNANQNSVNAALDQLGELDTVSSGLCCCGRGASAPPV